MVRTCAQSADAEVAVATIERDTKRQRRLRRLPSAMRAFQATMIRTFAGISGNTGAPFRQESCVKTIQYSKNMRSVAKNLTSELKRLE